MAGDLAIHQFSATGQTIRTLLRDGEPWFVARDVCSALEIANGRDAVSRLDADGVGTADVIDSMGRTQAVSIISESGLYELIFQSRKPEAKAFRRWITHEVLPAIRRTGRYEAVAPGDELAALELAAQRTMQAIAIAKDERARRQLAEHELGIAAPKAEAWTKLASANGDLSVADAAKILSRDPDIQLGERRLFTLLGQLHWIFRAGDGRWRIYQSAVEAGRLSELPSSHYHPRTGELVLDAPQVRITVKGVEDLRNILVDASALIT